MRSEPCPQLPPSRSPHTVRLAPEQLGSVDEHAVSAPPSLGDSGGPANSSGMAALVSPALQVTSLAWVLWWSPGGWPLSV